MNRLMTRTELCLQSPSLMLASLCSQRTHFLTQHTTACYKWKTAQLPALYLIRNRSCHAKLLHSYRTMITSSLPRLIRRVARMTEHRKWSKILRWIPPRKKIMGHAAITGYTRNAHKVLVGKPDTTRKI